MAYGIIICIVLLILYLIYCARSLELSLLSGFWKAPPDFCERAGITGFILHIADGSANSPGYIIMQNNSGIVMNNPVRITLSNIYSLYPASREHISCTIHFDWLDENGYDFFPAAQTLDYYPYAGKMVISVDDEVSAVLYADKDMSDTKNLFPTNLISKEETMDIESI